MHIQTQKLKWLRCPRTLSWRQIASFVKSVTRDSNGTRTYSCTDVVTTYHGNWSNGAAKMPYARRCTSAPRQAVCTMTQHGHSATLPGSRNTSAANTGRRSGSARSAPRSMRFSPTGRRIQRYAAPGNTAVIAAPFSQGMEYIVWNSN